MVIRYGNLSTGTNLNLKCFAHLLVGGEFDPLLELLPELVLSEADCSHTAVLAGYLQLTNTAQSPFIKDI
jgi:hypothetical protein